MHDAVCPIGECTATVRFEAAVAEVTPRYRLHDLGEVDEFAVCPACEAEVAGFYEDDGDDGSVELILDVDDDGAGDGDDEAGGGGGDDSELTFDSEVNGFHAATDEFEDPEAVLEDADGDATVGSNDE
jgi:hypothetical protein